jgi:predicted  nucleic acid-binding Zn-ribbon protein
MGPVLHALVKLQSVENRLRAVKTKLARRRRNVILQENQVRSLQNGLEAKREEIQLTRIQSDRLELELKSRDEQIAKFRAALNTAKTNKEYAAILTALNTNKADNAKIENQILELMKNIESDEVDCAQFQQQINEQKSKLELLRKETDTLTEKYQQEIDEIQAEWAQTAKAVPPQPLEIFKRVAETYDGEALAVVDQQQAYNCGGCFMGLPAEIVNQLMTKDEIIRCPTCSRILVLDTSEKT